MSLRAWLVIAIAVSAIGWWYSPLSPRVPPVPALAAGNARHCPPPPRVGADAPPLQSPVPQGMPAFRLQDATLTPLAGFSVQARILSREDYSLGRESELSPTDLALGWGPMAAPGMAQRLSVRQSSRWYTYRWSGAPPLPPRQIARNSANMHMIPADAATAAALHRLRAGGRVRIDGWLVQADAGDGWRWRSSLTRNDSGAGACELVYVCSIAPL